MMNIDIKLIRRDGGTQPRAAINHATVLEYLEDMKEGAEFPPVTLFYDGTDYWLADGFHRIEAAFGAERTEMAADVKQGTRRDAILYSVGANSKHGLRRTNADKRRAVITLLDDPEWSQWSNCEIARRTGVNEKTVRNIRESIFGKSEDTKLNNSRKVNRGGKTYDLNTTNIGKKTAPVSEPEVQATDEIFENSLPQETSITIGETVIIAGDHPDANQSARITELPNRYSAIVEFSDGRRELINLKHLKRELLAIDSSISQLPTENSPQTQVSQIKEGINYKAGLGCEWNVKVSQETWNRLIQYQQKTGAATLDGTINRLLDMIEQQVKK